MKTPIPYTAEQTEMYNFCQNFLRTRSDESIAKFGVGKLHNVPFNYCMFYQIYGYEIDEGKIINPENRKELLNLFEQLTDIRAAMEAEPMNGGDN